MLEYGRALTLLLLLIGHALPGWSATKYICDCQAGADVQCVAGNNANNGDTVGTPWQTYAQAHGFFSGSMSGGDQILFCRGGAFTLPASSPQWFNFNCSAANTCTISDYRALWSSGDEQRPLLWQNNDDHGFYFAEGGNALYDGGYLIQNLDLRCTNCPTGAGWGFFFYNDVNDLTLNNLNIEGFGIGVHLAGANSCTNGDSQCNGQNDRIRILNSSIHHNSGQGILGSANELRIENNQISNNGKGSVFEHNLYLTGGNQIEVRGNVLFGASLDQNGDCNAASMLAHGTLSNLSIENNHLYEQVGFAKQGCWGIAITPAYVESETFSNVRIHANRVENMGNVAIGTASCIDCVIENNQLIQHQGFGMTGIAVPAQSPAVDDAISSNMQIRNNSILSTGGTGIMLNEGSGHSIVSNAVETSVMNSGWSCLDTNLAPIDYAKIDYNICGYTLGSWVQGGTNLTDWQISGFGVQSQHSSPGYTNDTDLHPSGNSAIVIAAGDPVNSSSVDFDGNSRPNPPSVGAYEWFNTYCTIGSNQLAGPLSLVGNELYQAENELSTNGAIQINPGASIQFQAGNSISLYPGFHAQQGSIFSASILPLSCPL